MDAREPAIARSSFWAGLLRSEHLDPAQKHTDVPIGSAFARWCCCS